MLLTRFLATISAGLCVAALLSAGPKGPSAGLLNTVATVGSVADQSVPQAGSERIEALPALSASSVMPFETASDGTKFLLLRFTTSGAPGVRLHFSNFHLAPGSEVFVYTATPDGAIAKQAGPFRGNGPVGSSDFWTGALPGDKVYVEYQVTGEAPADLPFEISQIARVPAESLIVDEPQPAVESQVEIRTSEFRGRAVTHEVRDGLAIFEGDIILGSADELPPAMANSSKKVTRESIAITGSRYRWPNGTIPYVIDSAMPLQNRITDAIAHWNTTMTGYVRMVPRTTESNYVRFYRSTSAGQCASSVGMVGYGVQYVYIGDYCSTGNAIHEIGHAFGLWHEQSRQDRNDYVEILWANIDPATTSNFNQNISNGDDIGAYDFGSVMHYPAYAFSINGQPTIRTKPAGIAIGQRTTLSNGDIAGIRALYPASVAPPAPQPQPPQPPQPTTISTTITTSPVGLPIIVDGTTVTSPYVAQWVSGTTHTVSATNPPDVNYVRNQFVGWSNGGTQTQTVTASDSLMTLTATYVTSYAVGVKANPGGTVRVNATPYSATGYYAANASVQLRITAVAAGWCYTSWTGLLPGTVAEPSLLMTKGYPLTINMIPGSVTFSPSAIAAQAAGGTHEVSINASTGCGWSAFSNVPWITMTAPSSGTGPGVLAFNVAPKTGTAIRTGIVTISGGFAIVVSQ